MKRREFISLVGGAAVWPMTARAQSKTAVLRVGYVWLGAPGTDGAVLEGLRKGLEDAGFVEGRNIAINYHYASGSEEQLNAMLADAVNRGATDILITFGTIATNAAKKATTTIPVVSLTGDPIGAGVVTSIARPGGNITGFTISAGPAIGEKWLELLHECFPQVSRVAMLWNLSSPFSVAVLDRIKDAARGLNLTVHSHDVRQSTDFAPAFDAVANENADALIADTDPLTVSHRKDIVDFAAKHKLPAVYGLRDYVAVGGLMSYGASIFDLARQFPIYLDLIVKGAKPGDLPIRQPTKFELVLNLRTAKALSLVIPPTVLARADEVIE
jgi:putative ABC transport system substrate-binding protein